MKKRVKGRVSNLVRGLGEDTKNRDGPEMRRSGRRRKGPEDKTWHTEEENARVFRIEAERKGGGATREQGTGGNRVNSD
jgi:hypothetical protein